jgi:lactate dehydrogenase-like 2-hydroxyacid dehydrogenase
VHPGVLELENVVLLPHIGSATIETRSEMGDMFAAAISDSLDLWNAAQTCRRMDE